MGLQFSRAVVDTIIIIVYTGSLEGLSHQTHLTPSTHPSSRQPLQPQPSRSPYKVPFPHSFDTLPLFSSCCSSIVEFILAALRLPIHQAPSHQPTFPNSKSHGDGLVVGLLPRMRSTDYGRSVLLSGLPPRRPRLLVLRFRTFLANHREYTSDLLELERQGFTRRFPSPSCL